MRKCSSCGAPLPDGAIFCTTCGTRYTEPESPQPYVTPPPYQPYAGAPAQPTAYPGQPYGSAPAQQPEQAYTGQPPYGGPQAQPSYAATASQQPSYPGAPYGEPPKPPKKKTRWIIPAVAVVVVAAIVLFLVFGTGLFGSTKKKWEKAEREVFTISEGEALFPFKEAMDYFSKADKTGFISDISLNLDIPDMDIFGPSFSMILETISNLRLHVEGATDSSTDDLLFETTVGLGVKGNPSDALSMTVYNVDEHLVIEIPDIIDRPLLMSYEDIEYEMDLDFGMSSGAMGKVKEMMEPFTGENMDKIINDVLDIFFKYADKPVLEKGKSVTVEGITEKFDQYTVELKPDKLIDFMKDLLQYSKKNNDIKALIESVVAMESGVGLDIDGIIDDAIEKIEEEREDFEGGVRRILYVNGKNQPCGWSLSAYQGEGEDEIEGASMSWMHVREGDRHACRFSAVVEEGYNGVDIVSTYEETSDKAKTGELTFYVQSFGDTEEILTVIFEDLSFSWKDTMLLFEGEIEITAPTDDFSDVATTIQGSVAEKGGKPYQVLNIRIKGDFEGFNAEIELQTETHIPAASDINVGKRSLPKDGVYVEDVYELEELFLDPSVMENLQEALNELGIDMEALFPYSD